MTQREQFGRLRLPPALVSLIPLVSFVPLVSLRSLCDRVEFGVGDAVVNLFA